MRAKKMPLAGWGNYPVSETEVYRPERLADLMPKGDKVIARGLGRSYGDASLNQGGQVALTERLNRFLSFDAKTGVLRAEAGVTLEDILSIFVPKGWFLPVVPGTKFVTLGGAVAADIHGKNHHCDGSFGSHVQELAILLANGEVCRCSPRDCSALFWASIGGMGLTGFITEVTIQLIAVESAYMCVRHSAAKDLDTVMRLLDSESVGEKYSVAWIDCLAKGKNLGRSVVMNGHHAEPSDLLDTGLDPLDLRPSKKFTVPINLPSWTLNPVSVKAFNTLYYWMQKSKEQPFTVDYDSYFFPLDAVGSWNRIYGKKGFVQYQCVLPSEESAEGLRKILNRLVDSKRASFLAVLKRFGAEGSGLLSFPKEGYTLALDIPMKDDGLFTLLHDLDALVLEHKGRVYLAKDSCLRPESLQAMYPRLKEWQMIKSQFDPENLFSSDLSRRLQLGGK